MTVIIDLWAKIFENFLSPRNRAIKPHFFPMQKIRLLEVGHYTKTGEKTLAKWTGARWTSPRGEGEKNGQQDNGQQESKRQLPITTDLRAKTLSSK